MKVSASLDLVRYNGKEVRLVLLLIISLNPTSKILFKFVPCKCKKGFSCRKEGKKYSKNIVKKKELTSINYVHLLSKGKFITTLQNLCSERQICNVNRQHHKFNGSHDIINLLHHKYCITNQIQRQLKLLERLMLYITLILYKLS